MSAKTEKINLAAIALRHAHETLEPIAPIIDDLPGASLEDAYAVQELNTKHWLHKGRALTGRKIGATSQAVQSQLGVSQPDYGMLFADMEYADQEEVPFAGLLQPRVEGEIGFRIGKDLHGPNIGLTDVISAIEYAVAAMEIVDSRIADWNISIVDTIADNASSGLYVVGTQPVKLQDFEHRHCGMVIEHRGEPVCTGAGAACLGNPLTACLWVARKMVEIGRPLNAGDFLLSGALGPLVTVQAGETYELRINGLGSLRVRFSETSA